MELCNDSEYLIFKDSNSLGTELNKLRKSGEFCTMIIKTENELIKAHKLVLSARNKMFRTMLAGGFKESSDEIVVLDYSFLDEVALMSTIDYIYTGQIQVSKTCDIGELERLIQVVTYFELNDVTKWLLLNVVSSLKLSNMKGPSY